MPGSHHMPSAASQAAGAGISCRAVRNMKTKVSTISVFFTSASASTVGPSTPFTAHCSQV